MAGGEQVSILDAMKDQWTSMMGMAFMFVSTILIGLSIQPIYDVPEARAFGEEGASKSAFIALELLMIGIFTVAIIWLARRGLDALIKGVVLFALWMSMFYAIQPYVALGMIYTGMIEINPIITVVGITYASLFFSLYRNPEKKLSIGTTFLFGVVLIHLMLFGSPFFLILTLLFSVGAIWLLHIFPEWYVVNGVGIMVGAGVVTMIGVSFVPVLIILFMIAAAIYDHWAVNGSKHMLELADTMIDLKLPVLLVAPKNTSYTFLEQEGEVMERSISKESIPDREFLQSEEQVRKSRPKGRDALFMGLGDVIFPGMLVISSITFLPDYGPEVFHFWGGDSKPVHLGAMLVGLGTLFGGLLGYAALMTQVARGKPQAGLPLLNGGSILGYLISGVIFIGFGELWQDITFL